ncbi:MAG: 50S ribosomal protein L24 [Verrucomicrobiae bacterium]|nr:50S ribosomal protein L24 [Verrucomicrobiae bacterium]
MEKFAKDKKSALKAIRKGDTVVVISGSRKEKHGKPALRGQRGKVLFVMRDKERAVVEGLNLIKRHTRRSQLNPNGAIIEREGSIHISNLMRVELYDARRKNKEAAK